MQITLTTSKNNQNFAKNIISNGKITLDNGKAYSSATNEPYSGYASAQNINGPVFFSFEKGNIAQSSFYRPAGIKYGEKIIEKDVKKYQRSDDGLITEIISNRYNPYHEGEYPTKFTTQTLYSNGKLKRNETRVDGNINIKTFYPNGQLESSISAYENDKTCGINRAYFYDKKGNLTRKILPYRDETGHKVVQNEYNKDGIITKSTKAIYTTDKTQKAGIAVDNIGQLVPYQITLFNKKGEFISSSKVIVK